MRSIRLTLLLVICTASFGIYFTLQPSFHHEAAPSTLRIGVLPDEDTDALRQRYAPLLEYLSTATGLDSHLVLPSDYRELVAMFRDRKLDLAYFGGLTFVQALDTADAEPLIMRDIDTRFTSWFLVKSSETAQNLADFKGKTFTFGSNLSTSGHLMPRHFMGTEFQVLPEAFFSKVNYSGSHDETAYQVRDGRVNLGVANSEIIRSMILDGRLKETDLRILWETPPYPDYVWAVPRDLQARLKTQLRDAFLNIDADITAHQEILTNMGADSYLPANVKDFTPLKKIAETLGLLSVKTK